VAKLRLETQWDLESDELYLVEVKSQRTLSNLIAEKLQIHHESPQLLIIKNGECVHDASHFDITLDEVKEVLAYHG
jgi:bacillithiol system protein YtxJ